MRARTTTAWVAALAAALTLLLAACGGDAADETTTTAPSPGQTTTTAADGGTTTTTAPSQGQTTTTTVTTVPPAAAPFLADADAIGDLAGVDTYRLRMEMSISGPALAADAALEGFVMEGAYVADPEAARVSVSVGGEAVFEQITIGDQAWIRVPGDEAWIEMSAAGSPLEGITSAFYQPDFGDVGDEWENLGTETVNGRQTIHYRGDLAPLLLSGLLGSEDVPDLTTFDFDVWADPAGFVVKMEMVMEGTGFEEADPGAEGRLEYRYEVYDLGAAITITPPA